MTSTAVPVSNQPARVRQEIPRWDQQLRAAKNQGHRVRFQLAIETYYADDDCVVTGTVLETDKGGIKIIADSTKTEVWIAKRFIVGTEVIFDASK